MNTGHDGRNKDADDDKGLTTVKRRDGKQGAKG
jgi:hypothetical protein